MRLLIAGTAGALLLMGAVSLPRAAPLQAQPDPPVPPWCSHPAYAQLPACQPLPPPPEPPPPLTYAEWCAAYFDLHGVYPSVACPQAMDP